MYDSSEFEYQIIHDGKVILKTKNIRLFNIYDALLKELEDEGLEMNSAEINSLAKLIYRIYAEDVARIDPAYLTEQVFRLFLINGIEYLENTNPKDIMLSIYDNEF